MSSEPLGLIFVNACLINNFVLAYFLGICLSSACRETSRPRLEWVAR